MKHLRLRPQRLQLLRQRRPLRLLLQQRQVFLVRAITHLHLHRVWVFLVLFLVRVTTRSHHRREWVALVHLARVVQVVRLVPVALVAHHAQVEQVVRLVPVVLVAQEVLHLVLVLVAVLQVELRVPEALVAQVVAQVQVAVAALAVEPLVRLVRAVLAVRARLVSQSVQSAKSLNSAPMRHHLVVQSFRAVTVLPLFVCVAVLQSKTLQTRLIPQQVS